MVQSSNWLIFLVCMCGCVCVYVYVLVRFNIHTRREGRKSGGGAEHEQAGKRASGGQAERKEKRGRGRV